MIFRQHKDFPRCGAFFQNYLSLIDVFVPKVYKAFAEVCLSEDLARQAITLGKYPEIKIVRLVKNGHEHKNYGGEYFGECDPTTKNIVYLSRHFASGYEEFPGNSDLIESIVLHEMVHWARFIGGKPGRSDNNQEAGNLFEEMAYGYSTGNHPDVACPAK